MSAKPSGSNPLTPSDFVRSSIKALEVAIDQYSEGTPKRNESCVENCDKAVEHILKAKVIDVGESIYVKQGSPDSIKMPVSFDRLRKKNIVIPEEKKLLDNHKFIRNPTYHEGRTVSQTDTKSILDTTIKFLERFLKDGFNLKLREEINHEYLGLLDNNGTKNRQRFMIVSTAHNKVNKLVDARTDIPKDYDTIEILLKKLAEKKKTNIGQRRQQQPSLSSKPSDNKSLRMSEIIDALAIDQTLPQESRGYFDTINKMYDKAVNTQVEIKMVDYDPYGLAVVKLTGMLQKALSP